MFTALLLDQNDDGVTATVTELDESQLPEGDVVIDVEFSSLNYKDGMVLNSIGRLVRNYPHVPGVDLAGTVSSSTDDRFSPGDQVICTGWRVGEAWWGGYATKASLKADWLVKVPAGMTTRQAMAVGTAGFTAMQALVALETHGLSAGDPLLVTGASGGVGSSAVLWAGLAGHHVVASTGRPENSEELLALGATEIVDRAEFADNPTRPLLSERWAGCIDAVGGDPLAHILAEMQSGASVAACGLVAGNALNTTVIPFLLRGVNLLGIDSVMVSFDERTRVWARIAEVMSLSADNVAKLESLTTEIGLSDLTDAADKIMAGQTKGRFVVNPNG